MKSFLKRVLAYVTACAAALAVFTQALGAGPVFMPESNPYGGDIRVGLTSKYANLWSITLYGDSVTVGYEKDAFYYVECALAAPKGLVAMADASYYAVLGSYTNYNDAKAQADYIKNLGYKAAPCLLDLRSWTVYVGGYESAASAQSAASSLGGTVAAPNNRRVVLTENNAAVMVFDSSAYFPQFAGQGNGQISLGDRKYRGRIELSRFSGQNLTAVNIVNVEEYLFSVVPSEAPSRWHQEALKAQAVACRSYTCSRRGAHDASGYELCDGSHCQVYAGAGSETESTTAAVNATRDIMIWYSGIPVSAVYFSSSGGHTDSSENVWNSAEPFLRGVKEINEKDPKVWSRTYVLEDINKALTQNGHAIGAATGLAIGRQENGRVQELTVTGTTGQVTLTKEEIRLFFSSLPGGSLESRSFTIVSGEGYTATTNALLYVGNGHNTPELKNPGDLYVLGSGGGIYPSNIAGNNLTVLSAGSATVVSLTSQTQTVASSPGIIQINGVGSGHGVGMSQHGAQGMAEQGYTYDQILKWYYTGVEVRK